MLPFRPKRCSQVALRLMALGSENAFVTSGEPAGEAPGGLGPRQIAARNDAKRGLGALDGKSIGIKDNICTVDYPTTAGSRGLQDFVSPFEATVVRIIRAAGGKIVGKTNLDEFAIGTHTTTSAAGPVFQRLGPTGRAHSVGGSSGGSALAVASGQCWAALGTDTGGSVRLPATYTGIVGFKPSHGRVSRLGVIAYSTSLDTIGILARSVGDAELLFNLLDQHDPADPTSWSPAQRAKVAAGRPADMPAHWRIGIPLDYNIREMDPAIRSAWIDALDRLQQAGCSLHRVVLPATRAALAAYHVIASSEVSSNLARYDGLRFGSQLSPDSCKDDGLDFRERYRGLGIGPEVKRRILLGTYFLSHYAQQSYYDRALVITQLVRADFDRVFARDNPLHLWYDTVSPSEAERSRVSSSAGPKVDFLLTPGAPVLPPSMDTVFSDISATAMFIDDVFSVPASLARLPAVSIPYHPVWSQTPPALSGDEYDPVSSRIGLQIIGQSGDDQTVLSAAKFLVEILGHNTQH